MCYSNANWNLKMGRNWMKCVSGRDVAVWEDMFCLMDSNIGHVNTREKREDEVFVISHGGWVVSKQPGYKNTGTYLKQKCGEFTDKPERIVTGSSFSAPLAPLGLHRENLAALGGEWCSSSREPGNNSCVPIYQRTQCIIQIATSRRNTSITEDKWLIFLCH
jgi:hypothetical protein